MTAGYETPTRLRFALSVDPPVPARVKDSRGECCPFIPMEAIGEGGGLDASRRRRVGDLLSGYTYFEDGDIVLAKVTPCFENRKVALVAGLEGGFGFGTTEVFTIRPRPAAERRYLFYLLLSHDFRADAVSSMTGAGGLRRVPEECVLNHKTRLPTLPDQLAIADFLDRETAEIDAFIADQERLIELLLERRVAEASHAVTGGEDASIILHGSSASTSGGVPKRWPVVSARRAITYLTSGSRGWASFLSDGGPLFVQSGNLGRSLNVDLSRQERVALPDDAEGLRTRILPGDVLVCITGALTGNVALVDDRWSEEAYVNQHVALVRVSRDVADPQYLALSLWARPGQEQLKMSEYGGTKQGLGLSEIKEVRIALPPLDEQRSIAVRLTELIADIDTTVADAQRAIDLSKERRAALISAAVTGQLDVTNVRC